MPSLLPHLSLIFQLSLIHSPPTTCCRNCSWQVPSGSQIQYSASVLTLPSFSSAFHALSLWKFFLLLASTCCFAVSFVGSSSLRFRPQPFPTLFSWGIAFSSLPLDTIYFPFSSKSVSPAQMLSLSFIL